MGSYSRRCEIVEAGEAHASTKHSRGFYSLHSSLNIGGSDRKPPILKLGYKESLEDDNNQLFEAFCLKKSSKGLGLSNQFEKGMSPLSKDFMKRPVTVSAPQSPRTGSADSVSLKQALRELCISKASEMAATKRLSRSSATLGVSEVERIKGLYSSILVETGTSSHPLSECKSISSNKMSQYLLVPKTKSADQSAHSSPRLQELKSPIQSARSSPKFMVPKAKGGAWTNSLGNEGFSGSRKDATQALNSSNQSGHSSPRFNLPSVQEGARSTLMHNATDSASKEVGIQVSKFQTQSALSSPRCGVLKVPIDTGTRSFHNNLMRLPSQEVGSKGLKSTHSAHSSPRLVATEKKNYTMTNPMQNEVALQSKKAGHRALKTGVKQKEKQLPVASLSYSNSIGHGSDLNRTVRTSSKVGIKLSPSKSCRRSRLQTAHSSLNGNRVTKPKGTSPNSGKSAVRTKTSIMKKKKQGSASSTGSILVEVDGSLSPSTGQLVCHKCHCTLENVIEEPHEASPVSFPSTLSGEVSLGISHSGVKLNSTSSNCNSYKTPGKAKSNSKSREKCEFSQSSKSSRGDLSTSTSTSDMSNASRSSWSNRPHMPKDSRWQAIRHVKMQDGGLSLEHFNLLKKLGSGDIGTVYLAELIGSNCLFAIKVMDNEFLARRKKLPRALTERDILKMLDHPFLPTLYVQFTSDNLSCLVMEYCPLGDLHVLRQKQPARSFPEPAARFYVAEVLLALEYLHMLGIIYRDLKPENILVREDGHIMLTDFDLSLRCKVNPTLLQSSLILEPARTSGPSTKTSCMQPFCFQPSGKVLCFSPRLLPPTTTKAKKIKTELAAEMRSSLPQLVAEPTDARSNSFVGTHEYLAPEIIKGDGHGAAIDWWTFGILLYELLYGKTPFKGSGNEETLANVVLQSLKFPNTPLVSFQARDLIRRLLVKEPENRLGTEKGAAEIKQHPYFEGLNWALIRCAIPPEQPGFNDIGALNMTGTQGKDSSSGYLQCKATSDHFEFELF